MYLLLLQNLPDEYVSIARHCKKESDAVVHLKLSEEDSVEQFKDFLEVFRATGETGVPEITLSLEGF